MEKIKELKAIKDHVLVTDLQSGSRVLASGILVPDDNGKLEGIRPRWGKVYAVGPLQLDVRVGDWVLIDHGRWTRGSKITFEGDEKPTTVRRIDPKDIIMVSDTEPNVDTFSDKVL